VNLTPNLQKAYAKVVAKPEADEPRLWFAELADGDLAEFIRLGFELRDLRRTGRVGTAGPTKQRLATLVRKHPEWSADVLPLVASLDFRRGFVEEVTLPASKFLDRGATIFAKAPVLHAKLTDARDCLDALLASPLLERLRSLGLRQNRLDDGHARALAASPHLRKLRWLDLSANQLGEQGIDTLAAASANSLAELRFLGLQLNRAEDPCEQPADYDGRTEWPPTEAGRKLEQRHGRLPWLHVHSELIPADFDFVS
jgi:hypothetical protein